MTNQEAIDILHQCDIVPNGNYDLSGIDMFDVYELIIEALKKQVPKKPKTCTATILLNSKEFCEEQCIDCPNCGSMLTEWFSKTPDCIPSYCKYCGQAVYEILGSKEDD